MVKRKKNKDVILLGGVLGEPIFSPPGMVPAIREKSHTPVDYTKFAWEVPGTGGRVVHRTRPSSSHTGGHKKLYSGEPEPIDALFWEREQYASPLGPSQARVQHERPIGPVYVNPVQYAMPIGPSQGRIQYDEPIGPRQQTFREKVSEKAGEARRGIISARDDLYGYRGADGKLHDSGVGRINFFHDTGAGRLLGADPAGLSGHSATREIFGARRSSGGRRRRSNRSNENDGYD